MKPNRRVLLVFILLWLVACEPSQTPATPAPTLVGAPTVAATTASATVPPVIVAPTRTAVPTTAAVATRLPTVPVTPTAPALLPGQLAFYRLRVEYSTTSDHSTVDVKSTPDILTSRLITGTARLSKPDSSTTRIALNQPLDEAQTGKAVSVTVDLAIPWNAEPVQFQLNQGALNASRVRLSTVDANGTTFLREENHTGNKPVPFSLDINAVKGTAPVIAAATRITTPRLLWAFYYLWYKPNSWASNQLKDRPAVRYTSDDPNAMARQIDQAQSAGIDGFIASWWGPNSYEDKNFKVLLGLAEQKHFLISIYFETLQNDKPRSADEMVNWLTYYITTYKDNPAIYKLNGKPLVVVWSSDSAPLDLWKGVFERVRAKGLDAVFLAMHYNIGDLAVFDGLHEYGVFTTPNLDQTFAATSRDVHNYALLSDAPLPKIWAPAAQPGYDERPIPGRTGRFQERNNGAFYRSTFEAAMASDPDWIFITTWNEFWEHSYIEPSELYGDQYLKITREYADKWKAK